MNVRYLPGQGLPITHAFTIPPRTRKTIHCDYRLGLEYAEFSTVVESDATVVVDRTMTWNDYSSHAETAVTGPALTWYLAEGATHSGFDLFYLLQNPNTQAAEVEVTFLLPAGTPIVHTYTIEPARRFNIWVDLLPGLENTDVSAVIRVTNGQPIIVERAMYLSRPTQAFAAAHESAGVTEPATAWFLAEGRHRPVLRPVRADREPHRDRRPGARDVPAARRQHAAEALHRCGRNSRYNIWVDLEDPTLADTAVSTTIESLNGVPIIVERAMWWPGDFTTWHEAHNSPGATTTGTMWAMAEGEVGVKASPDVDCCETQMETFILIANTSTNAASAKVTLLFEDGTSAVRTFDRAADEPFQRVGTGGVPGGRRQALRGHRRKPRRHARATRGRARHVFGRLRVEAADVRVGPRPLGQRHQRAGGKAEVTENEARPYGDACARPRFA